METVVVSSEEAVMPIKPKPDETQSAFMTRCVPEMIGTGADKRPQDQAVAACLTIWRDKDKSFRLRANGDDVTPEDDETYDDFMNRCMNEMDGDEAACELAWEERSAGGIVHRTHVSPGHGLEFILSDATP